MMKKTIKKLLAALLAVAMLCAMAVPALAADDANAAATTNNGTITINNAVNGTEYKIYRILELQYNETTHSYRYVPNDAWRPFVSGEGGNYLTINEGGNVTWKENARIEDFAKLAGTYTKKTDSPVSPVDTKKGNNGTAEFTGLPLGWYLVVSDLTTDSICSIDTTDPDATIEEKNSNPTIDKYVDNNKSNNAGIGDTVKFQIDIAVLDGQPKNYVVHDAMSEGLTFNNDIKVYLYDSLDEFITGSAHFENAILNASNYTVNTNVADCATYNNSNCTFEVRFNEGVLKHNNVVVIKYSATVNETAVIGVAGNPNKTTLTYKNGHAEESITNTYVWDLGVHKYTNLGAGKEDTPLEGAEFRLYKMDDTTKKYAKFTETSNDSSIYKLNKTDNWTTNETDATKVLTPANGNIKFEGLDAGTYYLEETKAPTGYNKLSDPIKVEIISTLPTAGGAASYTVKYGDNATADNGVVRVENKTGTTLPSTGGIGTTIFYVVGGGLMVAAIVLLVTKKRMENK